MAECASAKFNLESGSEVVIRSAVKSDAPAILEFSKSVIGEEN